MAGLPRPVWLLGWVSLATDAGTDEFCQLATDGLGTWVAVWESDDTLGDTVGSDYDTGIAVYTGTRGALTQIDCKRRRGARAICAIQRELRRARHSTGPGSA